MRHVAGLACYSILPIKTHLLIILLTPMPPEPILTSAELSALAAAAHAPARELLPSPPPSPAAAVSIPATGGTAAATRLLVPNADGVIDVTAASLADEAARLPNPFRVRWRPASAVREIPLSIGGVLIGEDPARSSAVVNGLVYSPGDRLEGFAEDLEIAAITAEAIELRAGGYRARLPVQDAPLTLRIPRARSPRP